MSDERPDPDALVAAIQKIEDQKKRGKFKVFPGPDRVGQDIHHYLPARQIPGPWKSGHRVLVAVSPSPYAQQMIRWTRRLADGLDCPWLAVYVDRPKPLRADDQERLTRHLALARELGAEVITTPDADVARAILRVARQQNVTQIVAGKPGAGSLFDWVRSGALLRRLMRDSGGIELHVVRPEQADETRRPRVWTPSATSPPWQYAAALGAVAICTGINAVLDRLHMMDPEALGLIYLLGVVLPALFVGRGPALAAATAAGLLWDFFFLDPRFTFYLVKAEDVMMIIMFFVVALALGQLVTRIRWQERAERRREERATALYLLTRDLADAPNLDDMAGRLARQVAQAFNSRSALLLAGANGALQTAAHSASTLPISEKDQGVAAWAFRFGKAAGRFTDNLPSSGAIFLPLTTQRGALGTLAVEWAAEQQPTLEQRDLLDAFARQASLVLDRLRLGSEAEEARLATESEKLSKSLLNSISHELRTPLSAITAAASALSDPRAAQSPELLQTLTGEVQEGAARLNRLVSNLLDMTRLESGKVKPRLEWCDVADLIDVALRQSEKELAGRPVTVTLDGPLPLVRMDFVLMEQALNNLLLNAAIYTPPGAAVEVKASAAKGELTLTVADNGPGLPAESLGQLFNKFYRAPGAPTGGTGLGLSIVKGFVEAHGGRVAAQNRAGGGAEFTIRLPTEPAPEPLLETVA